MMNPKISRPGFPFRSASRLAWIASATLLLSACGTTGASSDAGSGTATGPTSTVQHHQAAGELDASGCHGQHAMGHESHEPAPRTVKASQLVQFGMQPPQEFDTLIAQSVVPPAEQAAIDSLAAEGKWVAPTERCAGGHSVVQNVPVIPPDDADAAAQLADQLQQTRGVTDRFPTVRDALAAGYIQNSPAAPMMGAHLVKYSLMLQPFDPANPSVLLALDSASDAPIVGVAYSFRSTSRPEGFTGTGDMWHHHNGVCVVNGIGTAEDVYDPADCSGTLIPGGDLWISHAWVRPEYPNPCGTFGNLNPGLLGVEECVPVDIDWDS